MQGVVYALLVVGELHCQLLLTPAKYQRKIRDVISELGCA
jgi:hypothetical protein